jgi:hypothetical protein
MYTIIGILIVLWLLGFLAKVGGSLIHLLLLIAVVVFLYDLLVGRRGKGAGPGAGAGPDPVE